MPKFYDANGALQEVKLDNVEVWKEATAAGQSLPQYLNTKYPTDETKYGRTFDQFAASLGLYLKRNGDYGIKPPTMKDVFEGNVASVNAGVVVREASPASRIMFPAVILEAMENGLKTDHQSIVSQFESMIAVKDTIQGAKFEQPVLNFSAPEGARSQGIAQGALPNTMLSISVADVSKRIPTFSLGMEITDEATQATSLDLVTLALRRQAEVERAARVEGYIATLLAGDLDIGQAALTPANFDTLDSTIAADGVITHKAWIKFLRQNWKKRHIDWVMCDLDMALAIENRTGKPTIETDDPKSPRINPTSEVVNPAWQNVKIFMLEDGVIAANRVAGLDSRYAMRRVRNSLAEYQAVEEFVLRRTKAMRFDFGEIVYRLFDDAWQVGDALNT